MSGASPTTPPSVKTPFKFGAPIPALLWESFEEVLRANMRLLAKDIASTLGQPEAPLLEAIRTNTVRPYLFEESDQDRELDTRCGHLCQRPDAPTILQPCQQPVFWSAAGEHQRCTEHLYTPSIPRPTGLQRLHPLQSCDDCPTPLYHDSDGNVKDGHGTLRGHYSSAKHRLTLFQVVE